METINKQSNKVKHRDGTTIYTKRADQGAEGRKQNWHRTLSPKQQPVGDMSTKTKQHAWDEESESETEGGIPQTQGRVRLLNNNKVKSYVGSQMCQPSFLCCGSKDPNVLYWTLTPFSPVFSPVFVPDHFHRTVILLSCTYSRIRRQQGRLFVLQVYLNGSKSFFLMWKLFLAVWE